MNWVSCYSERKVCRPWECYTPSTHKSENVWRSWMTDTATRCWCKPTTKHDTRQQMLRMLTRQLPLSFCIIYSSLSSQNWRMFLHILSSLFRRLKVNLFTIQVDQVNHDSLTHNIFGRLYNVYFRTIKSIKINITHFQLYIISIFIS